MPVNPVEEFGRGLSVGQSLVAQKQAQDDRQTALEQQGQQAAWNRELQARQRTAWDQQDQAFKAQQAADDAKTDAAARLENARKSLFAVYAPGLNTDDTPELPQVRALAYARYLDAGGSKDVGSSLGIADPMKPTATMQDFEYAKAHPEFGRFLRDQKGSATSFGGLSSAIDSAGNPIFVQPSNQGGIRIIEGVRPATYDPNTQRSISDAKKGGALDAQKDAAKPKVSAALNAALAKTNNVMSQIDRVLPDIGQWTAGSAGSVLSRVPGIQARDVKATIDTIKANLGFAELQEMRANSPTGGALGAVSEREIAYLQSTIANLEQSQSPAQLRENLERVKQALKQSKQRLRQAYEADYGPAEQAQTAPSPEDTPAPAERRPLSSFEGG